MKDSLRDIAADDALLDALGSRRPTGSADPVVRGLVAWVDDLDADLSATSRPRARGRHRRRSPGVPLISAVVLTLGGSSVAAALTGADVPVLTAMGREVVALAPGGDAWLAEVDAASAAADERASAEHDATGVTADDHDHEVEQASSTRVLLSAVLDGWSGSDWLRSSAGVLQETADVLQGTGSGATAVGEADGTEPPESPVSSSAEEPDGDGASSPQQSGPATQSDPPRRTDPPRPADPPGQVEQGGSSPSTPPGRTDPPRPADPPGQVEQGGSSPSTPPGRTDPPRATDTGRPSDLPTPSSLPTPTDDPRRGPSSPTPPTPTSPAATSPGGAGAPGGGATGTDPSQDIAPVEPTTGDLGDGGPTG
jgi:hypothetical protein